MRLTVADRQSIRDRAHAVGVTPSAWCRAALLDTLDNVRWSRVADLHAVADGTPDPVHAEAVVQLRRIGVNLNQAVRRGLVVDEVLMKTVIDKVDALREALGDRTAT